MDSLCHVNFVVRFELALSVFLVAILNLKLLSVLVDVGNILLALIVGVLGFYCHSLLTVEALRAALSRAVSHFYFLN